MAPERPNSPSYEQVRQEHDALRELVGTIQLKVRRRSAPPDEVARLLSTLCQRLRTHFELEESDGFFEQITRDAPRFCRKIDLLCVEHSELLSEANELAEESKHCHDTDVWWGTMARDVQRFSNRLMHHESEEIKLMQQTYNDDIGAQD